MNNINAIYVYENWKADTPSLIGTLYVDGGRGKQVVSFEYDDYAGGVDDAMEDEDW